MASRRTESIDTRPLHAPPVAIIFDGMNFLFRYFYGMPRTFRTPDGREYHGAYGAFATILRAIRFHRATLVCVCFDSQTPSERTTLWQGYKAGRAESIRARGESPLSQLTMLKDVLGLAGILCMEFAGYEADDCIATVTKLLLESAGTVVIASSDADLQQLLSCDSRVRVTTHGKDGPLIDAKCFTQEHKIQPALLPDFKALAGDPSDEIPGIIGIGRKRAASLLAEYGSLESILANVSKLKPQLQRPIAEQAANMKCWKAVCVLRQDAPVNRDMTCYAINPDGLRPVREYFLAKGIL